MGTDRAALPAGVRLFRQLPSILVESIFWDARTAEVAWLDITAGTFHRARLDGAVDGSDDRVVRLPPPASAVQPARGGGFVAALKDRVVLLDADGALVREVARTPHAHGGIRNNEGKVDPFGRFVVGAMHVTGDAPDAALYAIDVDGGVEVLRGGFGVANGFEWSPAGDVMYVTDTSTSTVYRGAYRDGPEPLGDLEPFLTGLNSDGLARGSGGEFWNGVYGGGEVVRWNADGTLAERHPLPAPQVTSVAFGGPDLATLFVGTARENLTEAQLADHPLSGSIFVLDVDAVGAPPHVFGG
ncbi:SMP-30/gluconolactonase/LRE family protein [Microbacterium sp. W1N]|uniref:SMP-30/gluconolactonase/LRE family protein n=1 Tax=Microbacterium festucae TaxID=2977531 RepID=UPI0021C0D20C|nr:SMP-30/gluconolactonase/LRE family protein [Microbacterium festucae]MCT9821405.1 SMP-30/gluconolactonase/LRE family protein [Microbacterium festucae]